MCASQDFSHIGFSNADLDKLFDRFVHLRESLTAPEPTHCRFYKRNGFMNCGYNTITAKRKIIDILHKIICSRLCSKHFNAIGSGDYGTTKNLVYNHYIHCL